MTTKTLDLNNIERKIFWILASFLGITVSFYLYSVGSLTMAVVERDKINHTTHELALVSGALEAEYLARASKVTLAYAQNLGFQEVNAKFTKMGSTKVSMAR